MLKGEPQATHLITINKQEFVRFSGNNKLLNLYICFGANLYLQLILTVILIENLTDLILYVSLQYHIHILTKINVNFLNKYNLKILTPCVFSTEPPRDSPGPKCRGRPGPPEKLFMH